MNVFGKRSEECLETCTPGMVKVARLSLIRSAVDFGVYQGGRHIYLQQQYFDQGKSKINPKDYSIDELPKVAKHIIIPGNPKYSKSRAIDILVCEKYKSKSLAWNHLHLTYIASTFKCVALELFELGEIDFNIRWGGDWDNDGVLLMDQKFNDLVHLEEHRPAKLI